MLRGDILVLELVRLGLGFREDLVETAGQTDVDRTAVCLGEFVHNGACLVEKSLEIDADLGEKRLGDSVRLLENGKEHVLVADLRVIVPRGEVLGPLEGLLHLYGKLVDVHSSPLC